jgi:hypothetical protein
MALKRNEAAQEAAAGASKGRLGGVTGKGERERGEGEGEKEGTGSLELPSFGTVSD